MDYRVWVNGTTYISENDLREALGIVDEHADILGTIEKLQNKICGLEANLKLTDKLYKEYRDFADNVCDAADIKRPYIQSGYDKAVESIATIKQERDALKSKCDRLRLQANAHYGLSCGYSADETPVFKSCNVISYSWNFGPIPPCSLMDKSSWVIGSGDTIRVELELTPNKNYKGSFNTEDLKRYIQDYGREKRLGGTETRCDINDFIDELCDKYNVVQPIRSKTTRERLDYVFSVLAENRERYNSEWKRVEELKKEKRAVVDSLF